MANAKAPVKQNVIPRPPSPKIMNRKAIHIFCLKFFVSGIVLIANTDYRLCFLGSANALQ
jgi:hypothetical protein